MTEEDRLLLNELKANVQRLFQEYEQLKGTSKLLEEQVAELTKKNNLLQADKDELNREIKIVKMANQILSGKTDGEAKRKINSLIREIDKCIALLNR